MHEYANKNAEGRRKSFINFMRMPSDISDDSLDYRLSTRSSGCSNSARSSNCVLFGFTTRSNGLPPHFHLDLGEEEMVAVACLRALPLPLPELSSTFSAFVAS